MNAIQSGYASSAAILGVDAWRSEHGRALAPRTDELSVEEPLEIRVAGETLAITMRTPGHDRELAAGFLLAERLIRARTDLGSIAHCGRLGHEGYGNVLEVTPAPGIVLELDVLAGARRGTLTTSACGVCGRRLIDDLVSTLTAPAPAGFDPAFIASLPAGLRSRQPNFDRTGGLHAAGIASADEGFLVVREDVGRHNAVDKAVGRLLLDGRLPARDSALVVSGRTSFEIVQKAVAAGIPAVVGISAPSSLAVSIASRFGVLLCGFARGGAFNVYAGAERLAHGAPVCT